MLEENMERQSAMRKRIVDNEERKKEIPSIQPMSLGDRMRTRIESWRDGTDDVSEGEQKKGREYKKDWNRETEEEGIF